MAKKEAITYAGSMLSQKYPVQYIRQKLKDAGYTEDEINDTIDSARHTEKHRFRILFPIIGILILLSGVFFIFLPEKSDDIFVFEIESPESAVPGSTMNLERKIHASSKTEIFIRYEMLSGTTNEIISSSVERLSAPVEKAGTIELPIPKQAKTGQYVLRAIAQYAGGREIRTKNVGISEHILPAAIPATTSTTVKPKPADSGLKANESSPLEALQEIREIAKTDESAALSRCDEFEKDVHKNSCYSYVAEASKNRQHCGKINEDLVKDDAICEDIQSENIRDSCLIAFFLDFGDYSVCHRIADGNIRETCETLRDVG